MSLVSAEDFNIIPYSIPNITEFGDVFPNFVTREEEIVLDRILGRLLASKFRADMALAAEAQAQRFIDLRDGKVYTYNGKKYYFKGLKSLMVPYIYFKWTELNNESDSGAGVVTSATENAEKVSPEFILSRAYNDFVIKVGGWRDQCDSLFGFLYNSEETYVADIADYDYTSIKTYMDDYFKPVRKRNSFGL